MANQEKHAKIQEDLESLNMLIWRHCKWKCFSVEIIFVAFWYLAQTHLLHKFLLNRNLEIHSSILMTSIWVARACELFLSQKETTIGWPSEPYRIIRCEMKATQNERKISLFSKVVACYLLHFWSSFCDYDTCQLQRLFKLWRWK